MKMNPTLAVVVICIDTSLLQQRKRYQQSVLCTLNCVYGVQLQRAFVRSMIPVKRAVMTQCLMTSPLCICKLLYFQLFRSNCQYVWYRVTWHRCWTVNKTYQIHSTFATLGTFLIPYYYYAFLSFYRLRVNSLEHILS